MADRKRTKQVCRLITEANKILKEQMVNFENKYTNDVFTVFGQLLLNAQLYKGFGEFYEREDGLIVLVGKENIPKEKQFIQFF